MTVRADDPRPVDASSDGAIEAVLLDIDGTLLDSNDAHAQACAANLDELIQRRPHKRRDAIAAPSANERNLR